MSLRLALGRCHRHGSARVALAVSLPLCSAGLAAGCNFEIPHPSYLHTTKLIAVEGWVSEIGPLNPDRVGAGPGAIAEAMPGDTFVFDMVVVDTDGQRLPAAELDSLWFQCGVYDCLTIGSSAEYLTLAERVAQRCDELDPWTLDASCELGSGDGQTSFVVPELGPETVERRVVHYLGVVGFDGRSARSCWEARLGGTEALDGCAFVSTPVKIGPSWWLLAYAETLGFMSTIPVEQFPAPIYLQQANRVPSPHIEVYVEGEQVGTYPDQTTYVVSPGDAITLELVPDEIEQYLQAYFVAREVDEDEGSYWFDLQLETITASLFTSNNIHATAVYQSPSAPIDMVVDPYAEPRPSRVLLVYRDDRFGELVTEIDFEVVD